MYTHIYVYTYECSIKVRTYILWIKGYKTDAYYVYLYIHGHNNIIGICMHRYVWLRYRGTYVLFNIRRSSSISLSSKESINFLITSYISKQWTTYKIHTVTNVKIITSLGEAIQRMSPLYNDSTVQV